jgi:hypothetical protein
MRGRRSRRWRSGLVVLGLVFALTTGSAPCVRAADRAAALAVIEKAVKAQGGADGLTRAAVAGREGKGTVSVPGSEATFTTEEVYNLPMQSRVKIDGNKIRIVQVLNGDRGWKLSAGGGAIEMDRASLTWTQEEAYVWWLATLAPLLKDGFELDVLPATKVNGRPASGVKVTARDRPDVSLYFDTESGLLVKIARRAKEAGVPVDKEYSYSDYKDVDGVKVPGKEVIHINGRKFSEVQYSDYKFLRKPDESAFARP